MEKTTIAATPSANRTVDGRSPAEPGTPAADRSPEARLLADWELVLVGGGDMTPNW